MKRHHTLLLLLLATAGCSADREPSGPGTLDIDLEAAPTDDGALVITVSGGAVTSVASDRGEVTDRTDGAGTHILFTGPLTTGTVATLEVPDVALARNYVVTVEQIASSSTFALLDPGQVRIRVVHPE